MPDQTGTGTGTHDNTTALAALKDAAERAARMLRTVPDGAARVPGLEWTAAETAAHLLGELTFYTGYLTGQRDARDYLGTDSARQTAAQRNAAANARQLREFTDRDMSRLADSILAATQEFTAAAAGRPDSDSVLVSNGMTVTVPVMTAALLGEQVIHGLDIARAAGLPWVITAADANLVLAGVLAMVPEYIDRTATAGRHLSYELRLRGGARFRLSFDDGTLTVTEPGQKADCVITADPVAFLLVGFGRAGQWGQIIRGKMVAGGRKPWLGFGFGRLLVSP
jgi:uncharacterized protein (TIGR03083 family)